MASCVSTPSRFVVALVAALALAACSSPGGSGQYNGHSAAPPVLNTYTAQDMLRVITSSGLPAPNPRNVTQQECPDIGCVQKLDTDTVAILKFPSTGRAELYAGSVQHYYQIEDIVLVFPPSVPGSEQLRYQSAVKHALE